MLDKTKLAKVLALTTSSVSHEALAAVRMANNMLKAAGKSWEDVLAQDNSINVILTRHAPVTPYKAEESWIAPHLSDKNVIGMMFRQIFAKPRQGAEEFWTAMENIQSRFDKYGVMTPKEYEAVKRSYNRAIRT